jgi:hypothetical protein
MTDNEKAATFIGWKRLQHCEDTTWTLEDEGGRCDECGYLVVGPIGAGNRFHDRIAPNMSKPENYMKALEGLRYPQSFDLFSLVNNRFRCALNRAVIGDGDTVGLAVTEALARRFDAEHPKGE